MAFSDPQKNIDQLGIAEGMRVADLGCGSGFYSVAAAHKVGPEGTVYAVDIQRDLLARIKQETVSEDMGTLEVIWGDIEKVGGSQLGEETVDVVIISNVLFQMEDIKAVFTEAYRILKTGGRLLVVEWVDSFGGLGPHPEAVVSEQQTRKALQDVGFSIKNDIEAGDHHYGIVAKKAK